MNDDLFEHYSATDYRVRLPQGGYANIRIDAPLPPPLNDWLQSGDEPWAFITAWNPRSQSQSRTANRRAQHQLLAALRKSTPATMRIHAGIGVGPNGWRESSLFVVGLEFDLADKLMQSFQQNAIVRGHGNGIAQLRLTPDSIGGAKD